MEPAAPEPPPMAFQVRARRLERDETPARALGRMDVPADQAAEIVGAMRGVFDFRRARPGDELRATMRVGQVERFEYRRSVVDEWYVRLDGGRLVGARRPVEIEKAIVPVAFAVDSSLYEAVQSAGANPLLALAIADAFAWDVDFYQDVRRGDRVKALVERFASRGQFIRYGEVVAVEYQGEAVGTRRLFLYDDGRGGAYYEPDGRSARKTFLKSPLKYAAVTSRYGRRVHPILNYARAHKGVDYAAAPGAPVWSVADGTVTRAGRAGASGTLVCVRHANAYQSCYAHLSGIARGVRAGTKVAQKQVIGYVGSSGLSTGPHLHYAVTRSGTFVNPLALRFPRVEPLAGERLEDFRRDVEPHAAGLDATPVAATGARARNPGG